MAAISQIINDENAIDMRGDGSFPATIDAIVVDDENLLPGNARRNDSYHSLGIGVKPGDIVCPVQGRGTDCIQAPHLVAALRG